MATTTARRTIYGRAEGRGEAYLAGEKIADLTGTATGRATVSGNITVRTGRPIWIPSGTGGAFEQIVNGHLQLIQQNPIPLTFTRRERIRAGTAFEAVPPEVLGTFVVRVHQQGRGSAQVADRLTGSQERDTTWGLIAGPEVPFNVTDGEDGNVRIDFVHPVHGWFRLRRLRALEHQGVRFGWQSDLERIAGSFVLEPEPHGRPALESDPNWVATMVAIDLYLVAHPGMSPRNAMRAAGFDVPPERTFQRWWARWKSLSPATPETTQSLVAPTP